MTSMNLKSVNTMQMPVTRESGEVIILSEADIICCDDQSVLENPPVSSNEAAKRMMADELCLQGLTAAAVCRILNIDLVSSSAPVSRQSGENI